MVDSVKPIPSVFDVKDLPAGKEEAIPPPGLRIVWVIVDRWARWFQGGITESTQSRVLCRRAAFIRGEFDDPAGIGIVNRSEIWQKYSG